MSYTLTLDPNMVVRDGDGAFIPDHPGNRDWQEYQTWLDTGNTPNPYVEPPLSRAQEAAEWMAGGLTVNFTSGAAPLSGRYACVPPHSDSINSIATSLAFDGNMLPGGGDTVTISDMDGVAHPFDKTSFKLLSRAIRDFIYGCQLYATGEADSLPPNITSKSIEELDLEGTPS